MVPDWGKLPQPPVGPPLLDRLDLHVEIPAVPFTQLSEAYSGPISAHSSSKSI